MSVFRLYPAALPALLTVVRVVTACLLLAAPALAQDTSSQPTSYDEPPPAHLAVVDGIVVLDRDGVEEEAQPGMPLVPGDRVRTDRGRVEVLFPDGSALAVDEFTIVDLQSPFLLRLLSGRLLLTVARPGEGGSISQYQVDTPAASAVIDGPGEYVVGLLGTPSMPQAELAVRRGRAELITEQGAMPLQSGERSLAWANTVPTPPQPFNSARRDALDQWAALQRDARTGSRSAQYLPSGLRPYSGAFDQYGAWQYDTAYGYVWYPTVDTGWRPYYNGYWSSVPRLGWTWIGMDRWAWPTHHYGRWGYVRSRWFWIPDRRWGPAWVAWGAAPGYVSWSPLGFDNRPLFGLSVSIGNAWNGWVVLPRDRFGVRGQYVHQYAVASRALPPRTPFVIQSTPPIAPRHAPVRVVDGRGPAGNVGRRGQGDVAGRTPRGSVAVPRTPTQDRTFGPAARPGTPGAPPSARDNAFDPAPDRTRRPDAVRRGGTAPGDGTAPGNTPGAGAGAVTGAPRRSPPADQPRFVPFGDFRGDGRRATPEPTAPGVDGRARRNPSAVPRGPDIQPGQPGPSTGAAPPTSAIPRRPGGIGRWPGESSAAESPAPPAGNPREGRAEGARDGRADGGGGFGVRRGAPAEVNPTPRSEGGRETGSGGGGGAIRRGGDTGAGAGSGGGRDAGGRTGGGQVGARASGPRSGGSGRSPR